METILLLFYSTHSSDKHIHTHFNGKTPKKWIPSTRDGRISELPEALRLHVLCLLPLKSAIRTGALSTRWRSLWTHRWPAPSSLDFRLGAHDSPQLLLETLERRGRRRLQRFALSFHIGELKAEHFRRCLDYAAACAVEDLHVHLANRVFAIFFNYRLPLGDPHLARLSLRAMSVELPDSFCARSHPFTALEVIHLHCVRISDRTVDRLVAACPLLHALDLRYCEGLFSVSVAAAGAHLRSLTVAECGSEAEVFFADDASGLRSFRYSGAYMPAYSIPATAILADLYICFGGPDRRRQLLGPYGCELPRNWLQLLTNQSNLTVLTICSSVLRRVSAKARARLVAKSAAPCKLLNLRELQLLMFALEIENMNDIFTFLVACCGPRLERLFVQLPTSSYEYRPEDEPSGSESEENESVEELSEQEATEEDELDEDMSKGETLEKDGLEEELSEGDAMEEDELQEELSEGDDLEGDDLEGDDLEEELLEGDDLEGELSEGIELEEELSEGEPPEEKQSQKHGSMEELSDGQSEEETLEDGDGFKNLLLVNMMNFKGHQNEMQLVSLFLKKSTSLNQLILFTPKINQTEWLQKDHMNTSHILERKLLPLRKASPDAQIVLSEPDDSAIRPLHEAFVKV